MKEKFIDELTITPKVVEDELVKFIKEQTLYDFKRRGIIIGVSGGVDSAVALLLAIKALGSDKVQAILLPEKESDERSLLFGEKLCKLYGVRYKILNITDNLEALGVYGEKTSFLKRIFPSFVESKHKTSLYFPTSLAEKNLIYVPKISFHKGSNEVYSKRLSASEYLEIVSIQNLKQRLRMMLLYKEAEKRNYLVLGTTNKTELELGQFVKYGDGGVDLEPLSCLFKTQIFQLAKYLEIPKEIVERPPTPDTWSHFTSDEDFYWRMPIEVLDSILYSILFNKDFTILSRQINKPKGFIQNVVDQLRNTRRNTFHMQEMPPVPNLKWKSG